VIGPASVRRTAAQTGFREEAVEKVLYLAAILERLSGHPDLRGAWVLKGGTALNLCHLDVPRLSVDVDINYIGHRDLEAMKAARPAFERAVVACCERKGCQVRRARRVLVRGLDRAGRPIEVEGEDLLARIFQHELDHLNGVLFVDRLSPAKRDILLRKLKKALPDR
jgi:hypothetical protein